MQPRDAAERQFLRLVTRLQVRGDAGGLPNLMRADWDRMKLEEALMLKERADKPVVDVVKLGRSRAMRAQFNGYARVISAATKSAERPLGRQGGASPQETTAAPTPEKTQATTQHSGTDDEVPESAFMKRLRARAAELAMLGQNRDREQDRD